MKEPVSLRALFSMQPPYHYVHQESHGFMLTVDLALPCREDLALALLKALVQSLGRWGRCEVILMHVFVRTFLTC